MELKINQYYGIRAGCEHINIYPWCKNKSDVIVQLPDRNVTYRSIFTKSGKYYPTDKFSTLYEINSKLILRYLYG